MSFVPIRWLIAVTLCFIGVVTYLTRININNAIVDMVREGNESIQHHNLCPDKVHSQPKLSLPRSILRRNEERDRDRFDWDPETQGLVLGSFFWSYVLFHTPHGYIAGRYGGKVPICIALLVSGIISIVTPAVAHLPSVTYLISLRAVMGIFQAGIFPGLFVTACNWVPAHERSTILAVNEAGPSIGLILMQFLSGYLMNAYSWTILFYAPGVASFIALIIVMVFLRNRPEEHPLVSRKELAYIRRNPDDEEDEDEEEQEEKETSPLVYRRRGSMREPVPWCRMLTNTSVIVFLFFKFTRALAFYLVTSEMPTYFASVLHEDLVSIGIITSTATALTLVSLLVSARIADFLIEKHFLTRTGTRKLFSLFAGIANAIFLMLIPALRCNRQLVVTAFFIQAIFYGSQTGSDTPLPAEMTTKFYAVLYAIGIVCSNIPGFLAPMLTGYVLSTVEDQWIAWSILFYGAGGLLILATLLFLLLGSARRQDFDFTSFQSRRQSTTMTKKSVITSHLYEVGTQRIRATTA